MNSNLWILRDFVFQLNLDFISNSNPKASGLLLHPYISLGAPPPHILMPISPQNQTIAATRVLKLSLQIKPHAGYEKPMT
jgi:hypothetical protein